MQVGSLLASPAAVRARMQLRFEINHIAFKLFDALSESAKVFFRSVARVFQRNDEA